MSNLSIKTKSQIAVMSIEELVTLNHNLAVLKDFVHLAYVIKCDQSEERKIEMLFAKYTEISGDDIDFSKFHAYLDNTTNEILLEEIKEIQDE